MTKNREIILKCTEVNRDYMRLPAGMVPGYQAMVNLYQRLADQSVECAQAWVEDKPCPPHEPAVDAFWWAVVSWSDAFGLSIGVDMAEWSRIFVYPHHQFANYLRPGDPPPPLEEVNESPANVVLTLDAAWTQMVIKLTARFGLAAHIKDRRAMVEARHLQREILLYLRGLHKEGSSVYKAYLQSDLAFFNQLFKNFPFSEKTIIVLGDWLLKLEEAL